MDKSFTLTITGNSSVLEAEYFLPIELSPHRNYALVRVELLTFNVIPNIDIGKNTIKVGQKRVFIPPGSYEIEDIESYVQKVLASDVITIKIYPNNNTLLKMIKCDREVDFRLVDSIGQLLEFAHRILEAGKTYTSDISVAILRVNSLRVDFNIKTRVYVNPNRTQIHPYTTLIRFLSRSCLVSIGSYPAF